MLYDYTSVYFAFRHSEVFKLNKMRNVYLMYIIVFLQGFVFYGPVATLFRQARGLSMSEIFIIESISWGLIILMEVPWGWISDRVGYKKTLIVVNGLFFVSKIVFYMAFSFKIFLLERLILSVVMAGLSGCDTALIYGSIDKEDTQKVFGRYHACMTVGFLVASIASTFIVQVSIESTAFYTIIPYGIAAVLTLFLKEVTVKAEQKGNILKTAKEAFADKSIILFVLAIALVVEVVQAITVFLNQAQYLKSGIDPKYFGLIIAFIQVARLISVKANVISKRLGNIRTITVFMVSIVIGVVLLILTANPVISVGCVVLLSVSISIIGPIEVDIKNQCINGHERATILSIYSMLGGLIGSLGNIVIGKMADHSLGFGFAACLVMSVLAILLLKLYEKSSSNQGVKDITELYF